MKCPKCNRTVGKLKKYKVHEYICKAQLICIEIDKKKELVNLREEK